MTQNHAEKLLAAFKSDPDFLALCPEVKKVALEAFLFDRQLREARRLAKASRRQAEQQARKGNQ
jgi:hypothetical protein